VLEKFDLAKTIERDKFNESIVPLKERLGILQRTLWEKKIPLIIVIEGWNASGITMTTHEIIQSLDPRGFTLYATSKPTEEERARPFLWRFWMKTPIRGRIALFARSWYSRAISEEMQRVAWNKSLGGKITSINNFERQLCDDGAVIVKFFMHIAKDEQKIRLDERERNPLTAWLVTRGVWNVHRHYDDSLPIIDDLLTKTDSECAPWHVIEATDRNYAVLKVYSTLVKILEKRLAEKRERKKIKEKAGGLVMPKRNPVKRRSAPENACDKEECQQILNNLQIEMLENHYLLFKRNIPLIRM